ncbi:hypothetical protein T265_15549, partial [Opisthorchis viverrini]
LEQRHCFQQPTVVVFLDLKAAFDSVDRQALWQCLRSKGVPSKFLTLIKALYANSRGRVKVYGKLSPEFTTSSGVRQGCPLSPFLFNFVIDTITEDSLPASNTCGVEVLPGPPPTDIEYADDIAILGSNPVAMQTILNNLSNSASRFGMHFTPAKCKVLLQDWVGSNPSLMLADEPIEVVDKFVYLDSCISPGGLTKDEISIRIGKARAASANLRHLWRRRHISFYVKGRVYNAAVRSILLYGSETWSLRAEDIKRLSVFDHRCVRSIARIWWEHRIRNSEWSTSLGLLLYSAGLIWFCFLSQDELNYETYMSENALLVGQVVEKFSDSAATAAYDGQLSSIYAKGDTSTLRQWLRSELTDIGLEVYEQNFSFTHDILHPIEEVVGKNLYAIMRSPSGGRAESLLLTVQLSTECSTAASPCLSPTVGLLVSLMKVLRRNALCFHHPSALILLIEQAYWAKDIVLLFVDSDYIGLLAWLEAYHGADTSKYLSWSEIQGRSGNIQAGLNLEFSHSDPNSVDILPEGTNGFLANLDLVNAVVRLANKHSIEPIVNNQPFHYGRGQTDVRRGDVFGLLNAVWTQASGSPTGLHGLLINYQIPAVTLRGPSCKHRSLSSSRKSPRLGNTIHLLIQLVFWSSDLKSFVRRTPVRRVSCPSVFFRFVEGILRSLNNLQERLHQSYWYYLLPNPMRYISIGVYMPPVLILIGSLLIKTIGFWCAVGASETKNVSDDSLTSTTLRTALSPDADRYVRKRGKQPSKPSSPASEKTSSPSKVEIRKDEDGIPSTLARLTIWTATSFAFGLFLHVSPKVIFLLSEHPKWDGIQHFLGIQPLAGDFLTFSVLCLFGVVAFATPLIITILYRFCVARECQTERPWTSSVLLISWTLLLTCMACLNVSASLLLSALVVPVLLIFVRYSNHSKFLSCLFGLCWILLSPPVLLLLVCYIHLSFFEKGIQIQANAVDFPALQDFVTRVLVQLMIESDLFGSWIWSVLTCGYSSLWLLSWHSILCE